MRVARVGAGVVVFLAACDADVPVAHEELAATAATSTRTLVARRDVWQWNSTSSCCSGWADGPAPMGYGETYLATTIPYGSDPAHKPITVYFHKSVDLQDLASIVGLHLDVMADDGIVVYLNDREIARRHMPDGPITSTTLALPHEAGNAYERVDLPPSLLQVLHKGHNDLRAEVHQADAASSDLVFDVSVIADTSTAAVPQPAPTHGGIARGSSWSYWDRGGDLGDGWRMTIDSDDTLVGFAQGIGPLGYGEDYLATTVGYGASPQQKNITTYFRKEFMAPYGTSVKSLTAELMFDDGVVVYLNGERLVSYSMPQGDTTPATRALDHEANRTYHVFDWTQFKDRLAWYAPNTLAVEVHQSGPTSSDLVFDLALHVEPLVEPTIRRGSLWRYWDGGGDLGTLWRGSTYDDVRWSTGEAPLGYGESYLTSTVGYGADAAHKPITTYFRKKLHVDDASLVRAIRGEWMFDDGLVVYVNGHELTRVGMPAGPVTASTLALGHEANDAYQRFEAPVPAGWMVNGDDNEIAVEVHQASSASSDLVFDLALEVLSDPMFDRSAVSPIIVPSGNPGNTFPYPWDASDVGKPAALHLPDGTWVLYYSANDGYQSGGWSIGRATSVDGVHWDVGADPVAWGMIQGLELDGTTYRMWWTPRSNAGVEWSIYLATSTDGISWTTASYDSLVPGVYDAAVLHDGDRYLMWSSGQGGNQLSESADGVTWTTLGAFSGPRPTTVLKNPDGYGYIGWGSDGWGNVVYETSQEGYVWNVHNTSLAAAGEPWVVRDGAKLRMWYSGDGGIGQAVSR